MGIEGIGSSQMNSTPSIDVSLGSFTQKNSDKENKRGQQSFNSALATKSTDSLDLSSEAQQVLRKLQARDREVRAHEQAHVAASGGYLQGGINYTYTKGPDNQMYAIGGSVSLDVSPIPGDSEATAQKARTIRAAALAPADPSAQDQRVAAQASTMELQARQEATQEKKETEQGTDPNATGPDATGLEATGTSTAHGTRTAHPSTATEQVSNISAGGAEGSGFISRVSSTLSTSSLRGFLGLVGEGNAPTFAESLDKVHAAYKAEQERFNLGSALVPAGTGINLYV